MFCEDRICGRYCRLRCKLGVDGVLKGADGLLLQNIAGKEEKGRKYEDCCGRQLARLYV